MKKTSLLSLCLLSASSFALTPLDDSSMANIVAKGGITLESTSLHDKGQLFSTGKITFSEYAPNSQTQGELIVDGIKLLANDVDANGNITGASTIKTTIDFVDDGSLLIKTTGFQRVDLNVGAITLGGVSLVDGLNIENARFMGDSYTAMKVSNEIEGTKLSFITQLGHGSRMTQHIDKSDVRFSTDVILSAPDSDPNGGFYSEVFLLARGDDIRLEFGRIKGGILMKNIRMTDLQGNNLYGSNRTFGSLGVSNINVSDGYLAIDTGKNENPNGIQGKLKLKAEIGEMFLEDDNSGRLSLNSVKLDMDSDVRVSFKQGIYFGINKMQMDMSVGALRMGNQSTYKGQTGSLAINSFKVLPGSYAQIQSLQ